MGCGSPFLAKELGMIYNEITLEGSYFKKGGWLYVDFVQNTTYSQIPGILKKYAARIPPLETGKTRNLFAAILLPIPLSSDVKTKFDTLSVEAAEYDDGFAKIVHAFQPVSTNLLLEDPDGSHPVKDVGLRLGWDDEQILIWYMRQLAADPDSATNSRLDVPVGVFGYNVDVREVKIDSGVVTKGQWQSLNAVHNIKPLNLVTQTEKFPFDDIEVDDKKELAYQVYPSQLDGDSSKNYWLPMYFANWNGKSIVLPDKDATEIYQLNNPPKDSNEFEANSIAPVKLQYGLHYEFQVRLSDLSGNGPPIGSDPIYKTASSIAACQFRRYVAPTALRLNTEIPMNTDSTYYEGNDLKIQRPLLGYPAVVFTGKYKDPISLLKLASINMGHEKAFGIADPDVECVEITVEIQTLKMDNLMSVSGQDAYIKFYTTTRHFPTQSPEFEDELTVPIEYKDCKVLNFGDISNLGDLGLTQTQIDALDNQDKKIVLPTARVIRLTLRAVCEAKDGYYGLKNADDHELDTRYGRKTTVLVYKPSVNETELYLDSSDADKIKAIYLKPDPPFVYNGNLETVLLGRQTEKAPDMIQRLSQQLGVENNGLTLIGKKGHRIQFGCSNRIRHTLSPDNSSITFASKGDLINHWLCCITLQLSRDWTWDELQDEGFEIQRKMRFKEDATKSLLKKDGSPKNAPDVESIVVGQIEIKKTAPFNALIEPQRQTTTIIFIDAVEPKKELPKQRHYVRPPELYPDIIQVQYTVTPNFKHNHASTSDNKPNQDKIKPLSSLVLPITTQPGQVPKIVSAGLALSPYVRNEKYSATQPRRRFLWVEFEEPVKDPKDAYFARVLAYGPDQLISNNHPDLIVAPEEPTLPIDPEYIRTIIPDQSNDNAGLDAMQSMEKEIPLEKASCSDCHYLLPLPPSLHAESAEMFGFFTYEFRVGHYKYTDTNKHHKEGQNVWTTAQGRFGRPLRVTAIQHPAPTLTCTVNRDEDKLYVNAPYAMAVHKGKNVTADPPRTQIWCLLYAQVRQADNKDMRNILLDDRMLDPDIQVTFEPPSEEAVVELKPAEKTKVKRAVVRNWNNKIDFVNLTSIYKVTDFTMVNKDAQKSGTVVWSNCEVKQLLELFGLPINSPLSILCVEILPQITNIYDHISKLKSEEIQNQLKQLLGEQMLDSEPIAAQIAVRERTLLSIDLEQPKPLSDNLGHYRILRTSPLVEVPFICTNECQY